nr:MAG TPA: hypothetical protein [Caudoviricetes sp.]
MCGTADSSHYTGFHATRKRFRHRAGASIGMGTKKPRTRTPCTGLLII